MLYEFESLSDNDLIALYHEKEKELNSISAELKYQRTEIPWQTFVLNDMLTHASIAYNFKHGCGYVEAASCVVEYKVKIRDQLRRQFVSQLQQFASK